MRQKCVLSSVIVLLSVLNARPLLAQDRGHELWDRDGNRGQSGFRSIVSITICAPGVSNSLSNCPSDTVDTQKSVLAPGGGPLINTYGGLAATADEHSTIFPPGTIPGHSDYLFWVATQTAAGTAVGTDLSGLVVLTGGSGPDGSGQWTLDYAADFGRYYPANQAGSQNGQIFLSAMSHLTCPTSSDPTKQDPTFDLNYADPGTVFVDPIIWEHGSAGRLLMLYEGTNRCIGEKGGSNDGNNFYSTLGVATSLDYGHTWPTYRNNWVVPLPAQNSSAGPQDPLGAFGSGVCFGNDCGLPPPADYGRYAVLSPHTTVADLIATGAKPSGNFGDSEPSAFVDNVHGDDGAGHYVYVVDSYQPPDGLNSGLAVARAWLNGGTAPLEFMKWNAGSFSEPGLGSSGGVSTPIFPVDDSKYQSCLASQQNMTSGAISYVEKTQQYLLTFVCASPNDPATQKGSKGSAWFYSTLDASRYDLSDQNLWSAPQEIVGSWQDFVDQPIGPDSTCLSSAWYPSFMSLDHAPGHLGTDGYMFYLDGCLDAVPGRKFSTRMFKIATK